MSPSLNVRLLTGSARANVNALMEPEIPPARDKLLFTPGPLTTSATVKQAMLRDAGSRDSGFIDTVRSIRQRLLDFAGVSAEQYTAVLVQGSGTYGIESVIGSAVPRGGNLLVVANGAYGERMARIASVLAIPATVLRFPEDTPATASEVRSALEADPTLTSVAVVHCETTSGLLNPVEEIGQAVAAARRGFIVDAMSSFGAVAVDLGAAGIDYLVSSANKCIEGVPGFSFVIARKAALLATEGYARSLSLDLLEQWRGLERDGQFRFTPPTHALLAFAQALNELEAEGGVPGRAARYAVNQRTLVQGMRGLGFREYLPPERQSHIITSFHYLSSPAFEFNEFYSRLSDRGFVIYPGKLSRVDCFRIGTIGRIFEADIRALLSAVRETLDEMGCAGGG